MAPVAAAAKQTNNDKAAVAAAAAAAARPHEQAVQKCPRCDSANTKFCYYNNYSLTQPRHFCKTCRRYWTKGGALRNVPIGGGCRKNKRARPSSSSSSSKSATDVGGLKFFQGFTPAMDFASASTYPKPGGSLFGTTQSSSFLDISTSVGSAPLMGLNFHHHQQQQMGHLNANANPPPPQIPSLTSSIESLSYINQDLHWKLQQQRLTMLFGGGATGDQQNHESQTQNQIIPFGGNLHDQKPSPQPIMFQNLEMEAAAGDLKPNDHHHHLHHHGGGLSAAAADHHHHQNDDGDNMLSSRIGNSLSTEWFFDSCYAPVTPNPTSHGNNSNINWNGMPAWSPYSAI